VWVVHLFCIQDVLHTDISWQTKHPDFIVVFLGPIKQITRPYHKLTQLFFQTLSNSLFIDPTTWQYNVLIYWHFDWTHHLNIVPVHAMKAYRGCKGTAPLNFNLGSRWRWVINLMLQPFCPWKTASVLTDYRTRGLSESVWTVKENRKSLVSARTRILDCPDCTESLRYPCSPGSL
jgi:hypothetical protein